MRTKLILFSILVFSVFSSPFCQDEEAGRLAGGVELHFSPGGGARKAITERLASARTRIDVAMYLLSDRDLADALIAAHERRVSVRVLLDGSQDENVYSLGRFLHDNGVAVRVDRSHILFPGETQGIMHNKFAVIDTTTVITGSYNWTYAAEIYNDENLLILSDAPHLASLYEGRFEKLWGRGVPYDVKQLPAPIVISATDRDGLKENAGENAYVHGVVYDVYYSRRSGTYFLHFGPDRSSFTGVIFKSAAKTFAEKAIDPREYEKKDVELYGRIIDHPEYGLEIIIEGPSQIRLLSEGE